MSTDRNQKLARMYQRLCLVLYALVVAPQLAAAPQEAHSESVLVSGSVVDSSGGVVVGAQIKLRSVLTNETRVTTTNNQGAFQFDRVPAGSYELTCSMSGFASVSRKIVFNTGQQKPIEITLEPGAVKQSVTVTAPLADYSVKVATSTMRVETPILEIPHSITVVPKIVLEDRQTVHVGDAAEVVAGVSRTIGYTEYGDRYVIRGFLADYSLRNGFKNNTFLSITDMSSIEQVEVWKGPAGVLYGKVEPGGVVNVVTKQPLEDLHYSVEGQFDNYGTAKPSLDITGPLNRSETLFYRLIGSYDDAKSARDFVYSQTPFLAPSLTWKIAKRTTLSLEGEYMRLRGRPDAGLPNDPIAFTLPVNRSLGEPNDVMQNQNSRFGYFLTHHLNQNWRLTNAFSIFNVDAVRAQAVAAFPGSSSGGTQGSTVVDSLGDAYRDWEQLNESSKDYGTHTDLVGKVATGPVKHTLLVGFELVKNPMTITWDELIHLQYPASGIQIPGAIIPYLNLYKPDYSNFPFQIATLNGFFSQPHIDAAYYQQERSDGIYVQDQLALSRQWKLLLGARQDFAATTRTIQEFAGGGTVKDHFNRFSPHLGIVYQPVPVASLYFSYSRSFTYIPFNIIYFQESNPSAPSKPTQSIQYESGLKLDILKNRLQATMSYFYLSKDNLPILTSTSIVQGQTQSSRGAELDLTAQLRQNWNAIVSYAYDYVNYPYNASAVAQTAHVWNAPLHSGNVWTTYRLSSRRLPHLVFGVGANYRDGTYYSLISNVRVPAFTRLDAMAADEFKEHHYRIQFNVKDFTNHRYYDTDAEMMLLYPYARLYQASMKYQF